MQVRQRCHCSRYERPVPCHHERCMYVATKKLSAHGPITRRSDADDGACTTGTRPAAARVLLRARSTDRWLESELRRDDDGGFQARAACQSRVGTCYHPPCTRHVLLLLCVPEHLLGFRSARWKKKSPGACPVRTQEWTEQNWKRFLDSFC